MLAALYGDACTFSACEMCRHGDDRMVIPEIQLVEPESPVRVGDLVIDANGRVWAITHYYGYWDNEEHIEFHTIGKGESSKSSDICWCKAGHPENDNYENHMDNDPHGPFKLLVIED